jgi:hypothetical protein
MTSPDPATDEASTGALASALEGVEAAALALAAKLGAVDFKPNVVQVEIDGLTYTSQKFAATVGLEVWPRLLAMVGSSVTRTVARGDFGSLGRAIVLGVMERAASEGIVSLVRDLVKNVSCDRLRVVPPKAGKVLDVFDEHFAGEYGHLLKVLALAIMHNLAGPTLGAR